MLTGGIITAFIFGLIFGSFLNVVIIRWDDWMSILVSRSKCPNCKTQLKWYDLIPIISFLSISGKCRYCQKPVSWQYPVVELVTALLVTLGYTFFFPALGDVTLIVISFIAYLIVVGLMVTVFFHDLYEMMVPDLMAYILLFVAIILGVALYGWQPTLYGLLIGVLPIALLVYPSKGVWMGEGDVKIAAALGAFVGYPGAITYIALAFLIGGIYGVLAIILKRVKMRTAVPFAPFLIVAAITTFFYGEQIVSWYMRTFSYAL